MKASGENEPKRHFFKSNKSKYPMYPLHEEKIRWDDYGEIIRPEDWMDTSMATNTDPNDDPNAPGFNGKIFHIFFFFQKMNFDKKSYLKSKNIKK